MELPGKRKSGRPKRRFMDVMKEGDVTEEDTGEEHLQMENPLWQPLMGKYERRRQRSIGPIYI